jgi:hypothetical protein
MPKPFRSAPAFCLLILLVPAAVRAADPFDQVGFIISSPLLSPRGLRNLGMGTTGTASLNPVSTGYFNPATIAWTDGVLLAGEHQDLSYSTLSGEPASGDLRLSAGVAVSPAWRVGGLVGYLSAERFDPFTGILGIPADDTHDQMLTALGCASWTRGTVSIGGGATARHLSFHDVDLDGTDVSGWVFDLGLLTAFTFEPGWGLARLRLGIAVTDLDNGWSDSGVRHHEIPGESRLGVGIDIASSTTTVAGRRVRVVSGSVDLDEYSGSDSDLWALAAGLELSILDLVQVRIGHVDETGADTTYGFGLEWEFGRWMVRGDYAHESWSGWTPDSGSSARTTWSLRNEDTFGLAAGMRL